MELPRVITTPTGAVTACGPTVTQPTTATMSGPNTCVAPGVDDWCPSWQSAPYSSPANKLNSPGFFSSRHITTASPDGRQMFLAGTSDQDPSASATDYQVVTLAYDAASGNENWAATFQPPAGFQSFPSAISIGGSRVFVTIIEESSTSVIGATAAYDASSGALLWTASDSANDNVAAPDGSRVYLTDGESITAYDGSTGSPLWVTSPLGCVAGRLCGGFAIASAAGDVYMSAVQLDSQTFHVLEFDLLVADGATGATVTTGSLSTSGKADDQAGLAVSSDGSRAFIVFQALPIDSSGSLHTVMGVAAFDGRTGANLWQSDYLGPPAPAQQLSLSNSAPWSWGPIAVSPDGSRVFAAADSSDGSFGTGGGAGFTTVAYDSATGAQLWANADNTTTPFYAITVAFPVVAVDPGGRAVYVTGPAAPNAETFATHAYDPATGAVLQSAVYAGNGYASGQTLSPDGGRLFVAAAVAGSLNTTTNSRTVDITTFAYTTGAGPVSAVPEAPWIPALVASAAAATGLDAGRRSRRLLRSSRITR